MIEIVFEKFPLYAYWAIIGLILSSPVAILLVSGMGTITVMSVITGIVALAVGFVAWNAPVPLPAQSARLTGQVHPLSLYGAVGAVVSVCDSLNYLLEEEDILQVFRLVNNYLYPGGVFIFDFKGCPHP